MRSVTEIISELQSGQYKKLLEGIYVDTEKTEYQISRYTEALNQYKKYFGNGMVAVFSAPGRTEIGGNHTDHQCGEVLAASIDIDAIAVVSKTDCNEIKILSKGYPEFNISLDNLEKNDAEEGSTKALVKGVLFAIRESGYRIGGFNAYITSDVLIGAGLSSSAAFETLIGTIISGLYNDMTISPEKIAIMGQYAENKYFGKPCGLMDQMACSVGSLVHIDFKNPSTPIVEKIEFDLDSAGYSLCITDTKGSHADLTEDYAAVPNEMKNVASYFGQEVLRDVTMENIIENIDDIRKCSGDRAILRALHFVQENERVREEVKALKTGDMPKFLENVKKSGDSSFKYLQNVYTNKDVNNQNVSIALAVSEILLGEKGVCRVHGGGFAGTIQAFVKKEKVNDYRMGMEKVFGKGSCRILKIRKQGGMKVL